MHKCLGLAAAVLGGVALMAQGAVYPVASAPSEFAEPVTRAMKAFDSLQATLSARLMEEMKAGGPTRAVGVCRDEAPALTAKIGQEAGMALGRTSDRLRNPANEPRPWVRPLLAKAAGRKAGDVQPLVVDLGASVGVLRPIGTASACTTCHGTDARRPAALKEVWGTHYPKDRAVGFEEGDLRGFFWAEVPKTR